LKAVKLRNEKKNATIRYYGWRLPKVEDDLQDARRSNEEKDGHIQLVTDQKKLQIQTMKRLKKEVNSAKVEADQRELLNSKLLISEAPSEAEKAKAELRVETLQGEATTLQDRVNAEMKLKAEAETRVETLQGEAATLQNRVEFLDTEMKLKAEAETCVTAFEREVKTLKQEVEGFQFKYKQAENEKKNLLQMILHRPLKSSWRQMRPSRS
jgi:chromosome segregation ATPase